MGIIVNVSEPSLDLALYGDRSGFMQNYLMQQMQQMGTGLNEFGLRMQQAMQTSYNFVTDQLVQYGLRNELANTGILVLDDTYSELLDWESLQLANPTMQRWVMSNPNVRAMYNEQNIDGYSGEYQDIFGGGIEETDYNYRRVMNGVVKDQEEDDYVVNHYYEDLIPGDKDLTHYEQCQILSTWNAIDFMMQDCKWDFTCNSGEPTRINK